MARPVARCWGVVRPARAAVFSWLHGGKNRERRPASSTGKSRARQGAGPPHGQGSGSARSQSFTVWRRYLTHPYCQGEPRRPASTFEQREKYETNPISRKPIAINELRFVLRAEAGLAKGDNLIHGQSQQRNRSSPRYTWAHSLFSDERGPRRPHLAPIGEKRNKPNFAQPTCNQRLTAGDLRHQDG